MTEEEIKALLAARESVVVGGVTFDHQGTRETRLNTLIGVLEDGLATSVTEWGRTWAINDLRALRALLLAARGCL